MTGVARTAWADLTLVWAARFGLHVGLVLSGFLLAYQLRRPVPFTRWLTGLDAFLLVRSVDLYALIGARVALVVQTVRLASTACHDDQRSSEGLHLFI